MSQATSQYGNMFIEGMLAGQKSKQLDSDLQSSEIQRKLLELNLAHNQVLQPLLIAHQQSQNRQQELQNENEQIRTRLLNDTYSSAVSEAGSKASEAKSRAELEGVRLKEFQDSSGARRGTENAGMIEAQTKALTAGLENLGSTSYEFSPYEISTLISPTLDQMNVPKDPAVRNYWLNVAGGQIQAKQQRFRDNKAYIDSQIQANEAAASARRGEMLDHAVRSGALLGDLASQAPERWAALRPGLAKLYGEDVLSVGDMAVESARRQRENTSPLDREEAKALSSEWRKLNEQLREAEAKRDVAKAGSPGRLWGRNVDEESVAAAEANVQRIKGAIADNERERGVRRESAGGKIINSAKPDALTTQVLKVAGSFPKRELTPAELDVWHQNLTKAGVKITKDQLKSMLAKNLGAN